MLNLPDTEQLNRGILAFNVDDAVAQETLDEIASRCSATIFSYLSNEATLDESTKNSFFEIYNKPTEERVYSLIHINQAKLVEFADLITPLISEARPLKIIFLIELNKLSDIPENIANILFGNIPNYLLGNFSLEEREFFNKLTNNSVLTDKDSLFWLSYITDDKLNRKTIPLTA